jgi:hypothetical protein
MLSRLIPMGLAELLNTRFFQQIVGSIAIHEG